MSKPSLTRAVAFLALALLCAPAFAGEILNGVPENQRDDLGYYYAMTGGKFPTGTTPNGDNGSGGTFRFLADDPAWGHPIGSWRKDDWFPTNAGLALTLKNGGATVYDNNGIEDGSHGSYYDGTGIAASGSVPGLYRGYAMSNNFDWIYATYFKLETETTIDTIIGYFDANSGFDPASSEIRYDMNIFSSYLETSIPNSYMPAVTSFTGDVFAARTHSGTFAWSDTGVDRIFGDDQANIHDDIFRLTYTLDAPLTLAPGVYFFSHDAEIAAVPLPSAAWAGLALLAGLGVVRRRRRR